MMKKYLFALVLSTSIFAPLPAQNFPFPTSDAEWITTWASGCIGGSHIYNVWRDYIGGDTVIQQKLYKKIYHRRECYLVTQGNHCDYSYTNYDIEGYPIGALRVENQRVYFQKFAGSSPSLHTELMPAGIDVLLYDYGWQVGDTLFAPLNNGSANNFKVTEISTLPSGRKQFKLINISFIGFQRLITEGVGSTVGLFGNYANPFNSAVECCFNHNGSVVQTSEYCSFCGYVSVTPSPSDIQLKVYPNPASDQLFIEMPDNTKALELKFYNLQGQCLYEDLNFLGQTQVAVGRWSAQSWIFIVVRDPSSAHTWIQKIQLNQ